MKIQGEATYTTLSGERHNVSGIGNIPDNVVLKDLKSRGAFSFVDLSCEQIDTEGECSGKSLAVTEANIKGNIKVDSVVAKDYLKIQGKAEIDRLETDRFLMESRAGFLGTVRCREIIIFEKDSSHSGGGFLGRIFGGHVADSSRVRIRHLTASSVNLQNTDVAEIECDDAIIGTNSHVGRLIFRGKCEIAEDARVDEKIHQ